MDNRKLIAFGTNSFVISLPKEWIERNGLRKGDIINLAEMGEDIIISGKDAPVQKNEEITVKIDGKKINYISTEIVTAYLKGVDSFVIEGSTLNDMIVDIRKIVSNLPGLEIMHLTSSVMKIKNLLNERNVSVSEILLRTHYMLSSMMDDTLRCFERDISKSIAERDNDVNRMVFLSSRVLHKALKDSHFARDMELSSIDILTKWQILIRVERLGDISKRIARDIQIIHLSPQEKKILKEIYGILVNNYKDIMEGYEKRDMGVLLAVSTEIKEHINSICTRFLSSHRNSEAYPLLENYKNMASAIEHIAQSALRVD